VKTAKPDYSALKLVAVEPPQDFRGQMKPDGILKNAYRARNYMRWLFEFIEQNTTPGEKILVYGKLALLSFGIHTEADFNDAGTEDRNLTTYKGRELHWVNMGRGRGINRWKDCNVYIRLGDFHMKKRVAISNVGSITGHKFTGEELAHLSSPTAKHPQVSLVMETHIAVANKQDAARTCIRNLGDDGKCPPARAYMIDCKLPTLVKYHDEMFPSAPPYELVGYNVKPSPKEDATGADRQPSQGAAAAVAALLLTTDLKRLSVADLSTLCGMLPNLYMRTIRTATVKEGIAARGWRETTRSALGLPGKGKLLIRD